MAWFAEAVSCHDQIRNTAVDLKSLSRQGAAPAIDLDLERVACFGSLRQLLVMTRAMKRSKVSTNRVLCD